MNLIQIFFLFFLTVPVVEIFFLIKIGGVIGVMPTVVLVVSTAIVGGMLLRFQGLSTLQRLQDTLARGELPAREMIEGPLLLVGGALLLTPGFFTDAMGFCLLVPQSRKWLVKYLIEHHFQSVEISAAGKGRQSDYNQGHTIDGEFRKDE